MNSLNFNQVGGFPLTTRILDEIQKAYNVFNALGAIAGDKSIISGCVITGSIVSDGVVFVNGEVLEFKGGNLQTKVKIFETVETLVFEDNTAKSVIKTHHVGFGTGIGTMEWVDFKRGLETKNLQATFQTINESLQIISTKLATIQEGAQVQLPADFDATAGVSRILNKPNISSPFLLKGVYAIGEIVGNDNIRTVNLATNVNTADYMVLGIIFSKSADFNEDNDITFAIRQPTTTSFKLALRSHSNQNFENVDFHYVLIPF